MTKKKFPKPIDKSCEVWYNIVTENKRGDNTMINIRTINKLQENDGLTLKNGHPITYKSGWQVATEGIECKTAREAINAVKAYKGNCGIWYNEGIYYIDKSYRVATKKEALLIGKACNQISILRWSNMELVFCEG